MTDEQRELIDNLKRSHRIANRGAMMHICAKAAALLEELLEAQAPKKPAAAPKRARKADGKLKADDPSTPDVNEAWESGKAPKRAKKS